MGDHRPALFRQAVSLGRAAWGNRLGPFDQAGGEGGLQIVLSERGAMGKFQSGHEIGRADFAASQHIEQADHLVAYMVACLVARDRLFDGGTKRFKHEFDEGRRIAATVGPSEDTMFLGSRIYLTQGFDRLHIRIEPSHEYVIMICTRDLEKRFTWRWTGIVKRLRFRKGEEMIKFGMDNQGRLVPDPDLFKVSETFYLTETDL